MPINPSTKCDDIPFYRHKGHAPHSRGSALVLFFDSSCKIIIFINQQSSSSFHFYRQINDGYNSSSSSTSTPQAQGALTTAPRRVFCYGDSLTAGTSPPHDELFPYGPHLERELNRLYNNQEAVMVRWRGLPGWTADSMVKYVTDTSYGLTSVLDSIRNPSLSLVIILAGTNDIGLLTSSMSSSTTKEDFIDVNLAVKPILQLHQTCLDCQDEHGTNLNIHTLAVGIPTSAWQSMNSNASKLCNDMNDAIKKFASNEDRVTYFDFPFVYEQRDDSINNWSGDGLHFSMMGYETLGKALAPCVKEILDGM